MIPAPLKKEFKGQRAWGWGIGRSVGYSVERIPGKPLQYAGIQFLEERSTILVEAYSLPSETPARSALVDVAGSGLELAARGERKRVGGGEIIVMRSRLECWSVVSYSRRQKRGNVRPHLSVLYGHSSWVRGLRPQKWPHRGPCLSGSPPVGTEVRQLPPKTQGSLIMHWGPPDVST